MSHLLNQFDHLFGFFDIVYTQDMGPLTKGKGMQNGGAVKCVLSCYTQYFLYHRFSWKTDKDGDFQMQKLTQMF